MAISGFSTSPKKSAQGFTLVEMVVTIGITSLLLMSISISGSSIKREFTLSKSQEELRSLITYARFLSVATLADPEGGLVCGYGVHIVPGENRAYIFRDQGEGGVCLENAIGLPSDLSSEGSLYSMTLDPLVVFESGEQKISFIPPDPAVAFDPGADEEGGKTIVIRARDGSGTPRQVRVLSSGMVSIVR
ncbi:MAG TPA: prepilin-type N-terminal cleavage/methylation domain-containing protein [Candidatus Colwellbacteria bacterium]|nr:prepilin-type N-terminal cleavage/methylation domain-containing protein [Candidatus Colwellbacteria bacterium]HQA95841.1 prepilin-type N-terminal cleavage/methylation domain-containing protein [Candidatus Colwellbacteria bacterium]